MDPQDLLLTALRASLIYFFLLFVIRILGKREVGSASAFDFMVALMLGEVVDEAIYGDVSLVKGLLAISVIAIWHVINSWASFKSKTIDQITGAPPTVMVKSGKIIQDALARERINQDEVYAELRLMGIDDLREVKTATLEPNGQISVLKEDWAMPVQKGDIPEVTRTAGLPKGQKHSTEPEKEQASQSRGKKNSPRKEDSPPKNGAKK